MALILGFAVVFVAGAAVAFFAGLNAARSKAAKQLVESASKNTRNISPEPVPEAEASIDATASQQSAVGTGKLDVVTGPFFSDEKEPEGAGFADTRRYERLAFPGTALATIYPSQRQVGGIAVQCEVQTRDLCCGGIGIAHTQRLLPQQTIVLNAVGKVLVGEVRWCQRIDKGFYIAGCRLIKTTT